MGINEHAALADAERVVHTDQSIPECTDILTHTLMATVSVTDEVRGHGQFVASVVYDPDIIDHSSCA